MTLSPHTSGTFAIDIKCDHCGAERDRECLDLGPDNGPMRGRFHRARALRAAEITKTTNAALRKPNNARR